MDENEEIEERELIRVNERIVSLARVIDHCRKNRQQLKLCFKLVRMDRKGFENSKVPIPVAKAQAVDWRYVDLISIVNRLASGKDVNTVGKATAELEALIKAAEEEIADLHSEIGAGAQKKIFQGKIGETIGSATQIVTETLEAGKQKLNEGFEKLKKTLGNDQN